MDGLALSVLSDVKQGGPTLVTSGPASSNLPTNMDYGVHQNAVDTYIHINTQLSTVKHI